MKEEGAVGVTAAVGKLGMEVGVLAGGVEKLKEEGVDVVTAGVEKVVVTGVEKLEEGVDVVTAGVEKAVVACVEATGGEILKEEIDGGVTVVKISWEGAVAGNGEVACADARGTGVVVICTGDDGSRVACLKRRILYESYATTSSTTMNASIWSRIGIVQPGTAYAIVLSVAMITLTPSVSAYNKFAFKVKLMSDWSR